eukprot:4734793-Pleurochrysis_carterae.AAC.1
MELRKARQTQRSSNVERAKGRTKEMRRGTRGVGPSRSRETRTGEAVDGGGMCGEAASHMRSVCSDFHVGAKHQYGA